MRAALKRLLFLGGLTLVMAWPAFADPPDGYPFVVYDEGLRLAREQSKPVFLYFGRFGCGWCDKTNREAFSDPRVKARYTANYILVYVDAESGKRLTLPSGERITERELGVRLRVMATPMFVYLKPDGSEIFHIPGIQSASDLLLYDRFVSEGHYQRESIREFLARELR
jgi:thioredoxin-related protein